MTSIKGKRRSVRRNAIMALMILAGVAGSGCASLNASLKSSGQRFALAATDSLLDSGRDELVAWAAPRGPETRAYLLSVADRAGALVRERLVALLREWLR